MVCCTTLQTHFCPTTVQSSSRILSFASCDTSCAVKLGEGCLCAVLTGSTGSSATLCTVLLLPPVLLIYICTAAVEPVLLISLFLLRPSSSWQSASSRQHTCTLECEATQCKTFQGKVSLEAALWTKHAMHASLLSSYTKRLDGNGEEGREQKGSAGKTHFDGK